MIASPGYFPRAPFLLGKWRRSVWNANYRKDPSAVNLSISHTLFLFCFDYKNFNPVFLLLIDWRILNKKKKIEREENRARGYFFLICKSENLINIFKKEKRITLTPCRTTQRDIEWLRFALIEIKLWFMRRMAPRLSYRLLIVSKVNHRFPQIAFGN